MRGEMRGAGVRAGAMTRQQHLPPWLEILQPAGGCWPHGVKNVGSGSPPSSSAMERVEN